ncbi:GH1 family beta-glucosidase [Ancylobacter sp. A5.8]|uniref:GH1 family beta-glucosidase n=1 Tax=Ancylobacter gelatini TaxID=2919920 RepID=UPI001F4DE8E6|nr:GH1 family beta-glucosidase [Ancylobacter gelatini]MCJ8143634.1 GH1 family beta-glucosidase [Ancylobacter gelatini]
MLRRRDFLTSALASTALAASPLPLVAMKASAQPASVPRLPPAFLWGASTSAYQIEGAVTADGRGPSIWDTFSHTPGRINDGTTGDVACDHYNLYAGDVELMARAGLQAYRFSIAWPRVMPEGTGAVNAKGLDFYDRLVDALLAQGISPFACLYHWDLPQALQDRGGWHNRDIAGWFTDYAQATVARLGDRVKSWAMLNEPSVHAIFGHGFGNHAPGLTGWASYVKAQHHQNLAQGTALRALRAAHSDLMLGTVLSLQPVLPATDRPEDAAAAARFDAAWNTINLDPLFHGRYPAAFEADFAPLVQPGDLAAIRAPLDFLGVNYYGRAHVVNAPDSFLAQASFGPLPPGTHTTAMGWPIEPQGMVEVLARLRDHYGNPLVFITENGACFDDPAPVNGVVIDPQRVEFLRAHLAAAADAIGKGCALQGYFVWSLLDNFEWAEGERRRFGVVHVDFATQKRTPKASLGFLSDVIRGKPGTGIGGAGVASMP